LHRVDEEAGFREAYVSTSSDRIPWSSGSNSRANPNVQAACSNN
jgi:hypothetical protein